MHCPIDVQLPIRSKSFLGTCNRARWLFWCLRPPVDLGCLTSSITTSITNGYFAFASLFLEAGSHKIKLGFQMSYTNVNHVQINAHKSYTNIIHVQIKAHNFVYFSIASLFTFYNNLISDIENR